VAEAGLGTSFEVHATMSIPPVLKRQFKLALNFCLILKPQSTVAGRYFSRR
jgi:hypothetical protein